MLNQLFSRHFVRSAIFNGGWWLLGVVMQIGAGAIGRLRLVNKTAG
jgi:hypothetical protein